MNDDVSLPPVVYDVIVDFGNGKTIRIEKGLSLAAAQIARRRLSKFFLDVRTVERPRRRAVRDQKSD